MSKLCVRVGNETKKVDLDGGGNLHPSGRGITSNTLMGAPGQSGVNTVTNSSASLLQVHAYFRVSSHEYNIYASITNNGSSVMDNIPVYNPGTDGTSRYPAGVPFTILLLKGDILTFTAAPSHMVTRVLAP